MELTDHAALEFLHDARVVSIALRMDDSDRREFVITAICHPEAGHHRWDGKRVEIRLHDLLVANHAVFGALSGQDEINTWTKSVSVAMEAERQRLLASGVGSAEAQPFRVTFQSGSTLEGFCHRVFVQDQETRS